MGMMLCSQPDAAFSMHIESLGLRVFSMEELCYCILQYPMLLIDDTLTEKMIRFLKIGAGEGVLAESLRRLYESGVGTGELLYNLLEMSGYCDVEELQAFRKTVQAVNQLSPKRYFKKRGDLFFSLRRYGKAIKAYERAFSEVLEGERGTPFCGKLYFNQGCAYANLFLSEKAFSCFQKAQDILGWQETGKKIYFLSRMEHVIEKRELYLSALKEEAKLCWDEEYEEACRVAASGEGKKRVAEIFQKDPVKRERAASDAIRKWKEEYRTML